jgi:hypothetical protein
MRQDGTITRRSTAPQKDLLGFGFAGPQQAVHQPARNGRRGECRGVSTHPAERNG